LFHASLEKSEPTIAAPITGSIARVHGFAPQRFAKLTWATSARRKSVSPSTMRATSAPTFATVNTVWIEAPSLTPRTFTQVSPTIITIATTRWIERPSSIGPPGMVNEPSLRKTSGVIAGRSTPR
jgi:hypothetical protein